MAISKEKLVAEIDRRCRNLRTTVDCEEDNLLLAAKALDSVQITANFADREYLPHRIRQEKRYLDEIEVARNKIERLKYGIFQLEDLKRAIVEGKGCFGE